MTSPNQARLLSRRQFLRGAGTIGLVALTKPGVWPAAEATSESISPFLEFDREIENFMSARNVPGGALAVVKDRRLVYTRGYGWADRENKSPVAPTSLFRIASISKPFTAVAVLKLVEAGKLRLDTQVVGVLASGTDAIRPPDAGFDERWRRITIRHLLQHTGGWDRDKSFDPMFRSREIAKSLDVPSPPGPRDILRYMFSQPLDFDPGARYAYSNFGYCVLGRVIEKVAGIGYETFVRDRVLAPMAIRQMRIGASLEGRRAAGEVRYYLPDDEKADSVFGDGKVPWPYGGFCLESMDAHGGWIASAVDLARFAAALHDPRHCPLLKPASIQIMSSPPEPPVSRNADGSIRDHYYACGWLVRPVGEDGRANYWHSGSLPGTATLLVRRHDGLSWAVLFNQRSGDEKLPDSAIDPALHRAADAVKDWPTLNLFRQYT